MGQRIKNAYPRGSLKSLSGSGDDSLRRAAFIASLLPVPALVLAFLGIAFNSLVRGDGHYFTYPYFLVILFWVLFFLAVAACARKAPLVGGLIAVLASISLILWLPLAWWFILLYLLVFISGILYILAWDEERKTTGFWK